MPGRMGCAVFLVCFALPATGQDGASIWDGEVMPQPFDAAPFHRIRIPAWVQETVGCGYTLSVMDSAARAAAASHGVTLSELGFVDPFYAYYDSQLLKRRSPHVPRERLEQDLAEYRRLGVRVLGVYPPTLQSEVYEAHPDWRRIATNTTEIPAVDLQKFPHGGMLCPLGPYGDFFIAVLSEILTKFPQVDAFSFDGLHHGGVCYCQHLPHELPQRHRKGDSRRQRARPRVSPLSALGRPQAGRPGTADAGTSERDQAGRRPGDVEHERRPLGSPPQPAAQHVRPYEPALRRGRPFAARDDRTAQSSFDRPKRPP